MDLVTYGPEAWVATNLDEPWEWASAVRQSVIPGVTEIQPGADSVVVNCHRDRSEQVGARLRSTRPEAARGRQRPTELAVVYDPAQLAAVGERAGLDADGVLFRHTAVTYRVLFLGERPGCPFLGPLDRSLQLPPNESGGAILPAGTVELRHGMCSVLTVDTVTDGHPIGRVTQPVWSKDATPMATLHAGEYVRFVSA